MTTLGVLAAASLVDGVHSTNMVSLLGASLLLGVLNAFFRPILLFLSLPLLIVTLGLFTLIINALLLRFVGALVTGFQVADFWAAFKGGLVISIVSFFANLFIGKSDPPRPPKVNPPAPPPNTGSGPVIDV